MRLACQDNRASSSELRHNKNMQIKLSPTGGALAAGKKKNRGAKDVPEAQEKSNGE